MNMFVLFLVKYLTNFKLLKPMFLNFSSQTRQSVHEQYGMYQQQQHQQQQQKQHHHHHQQQQQQQRQHQLQQQEHIYEDVVPGN